MANSTWETSVEKSLPIVQENGLNTTTNINFDSGSNTCALPSSTTVGGSSIGYLSTITSVSAQALAVGRQGLTNPAFNVDASAATQLAGLNVAGAGAAGTVAVAVISSGAAANLSIDAKGTGTIAIGGTSTGAVTVGPATTFTNGITIASAKAVTGAGTGANGFVISNPKNAAAGTLSGTALNVEISIGGVPYYFAVYPTKS